MQENTEKQLEDLLQEGKVYLETRAEYLRLYLLEKVSKMFADLITSTFVIICYNHHPGLVLIRRVQQLYRWLWIGLLDLDPDRRDCKPNQREVHREGADQYCN
jgi:hypothetical protein